MAAVRRSLFDNAERAKFLNHVVGGVKRILQQNAQVLKNFTIPLKIVYIDFRNSFILNIFV